MNIIDDPKLQKMFIKKDLSDSRKAMYKRILTHMYEITGLTPTELIEEAKKEQQPDWDKKIFLDIEDRKITTYLFQFYELLKNKELKPDTLDTEMGLIRAFYNSYKIELPTPIQITIPTKIIREGDIPDIDDIREGIEATKHLTYKAIVLFIASSGIRSGDVRRFTIEDFLTATNDYHDGTLESLLKSDENIMPCWFFIPKKTRKKGNVCLTFNSPESTKYIIKSIKQRILAKEEITKDSPLFITRRKDFFTLKGFTHVCRSINKEAFNGAKAKDGKDFFRAHNLRKFFLSVFRQKTKDEFALKIVGGHALPKKTDENYQQVLINETIGSYRKVVPFLSVEKTESNVLDDEATKKIKKELKERDKKIEKLEIANNELEALKKVITPETLAILEKLNQEK